MIPQFLSRVRRSRAASETRPLQRRRSPISFPLKFKGRIAFLEGKAAQPEKLRAFAPEAVIATLPRAMDLADAILRRLIELPSLSFAVIVLTDISATPLTAEDRDLLWRAFRVPVFEQLLDWGGAVIARECETHHGLHLNPGLTAQIERGLLSIGSRSTGLCASIIEAQCECGSGTPRLINLARLVAEETAA